MKNILFCRRLKLLKGDKDFSEASLKLLKIGETFYPKNKTGQERAKNSNFAVKQSQRKKLISHKTFLCRSEKNIFAAKHFYFSVETRENSLFSVLVEGYTI